MTEPVLVIERDPGTRDASHVRVVSIPSGTLTVNSQVKSEALISREYSPSSHMITFPITGCEAYSLLGVVLYPIVIGSS